MTLSTSIASSVAVFITILGQLNLHWHIVVPRDTVCGPILDTEDDSFLAGKACTAEPLECVALEPCAEVEPCKPCASESSYASWGTQACVATAGATGIVWISRLIRKREPTWPKSRRIELRATTRQ